MRPSRVAWAHASWPACHLTKASAIEQAPFLTEEQKRDILYHNAVRFLRLEQDAKQGAAIKWRSAARGQDRRRLDRLQQFR
jgi:hypothetical protein